MKRKIRQPSNCRHCGSKAEVTCQRRPQVHRPRKKTRYTKYWYLVSCANDFGCSIRPDTGWKFTRNGALNAWESKPRKSTQRV